MNATPRRRGGQRFLPRWSGSAPQTPTQRRHGIIEAARVSAVPELTRVVVAIDPAVTSGDDADETGLIVAGKDKNGDGYVLADLSGRYQPGLSPSTATSIPCRTGWCIDGSTSS